MSMNCIQCGKQITGEGMAFCPYCGAKLPESNGAAEPVSAEEERWIRQALAVTSFPERKKILRQGLSACPDSREIRWELLFIGEEEKKKRAFALDFSIIKCYILEIYRTPKAFSADQRERMRSLLFEDPELKACCALFEDPEGKRREYIRRLCREYLEIFLEGNSQIMGNWFGLQLDRNKDKKLARPVADMIRSIDRDDRLTPEQRSQLRQALYEAYAAKTGGKTVRLGELLE